MFAEIRPPWQLICAACAVAFMPSCASAAPKCGNGTTAVNASTSNLVFGIYSPGSAVPTYSSTTVTVSCTDLRYVLPAFSVSLSAGGAGNFVPRKMSNGAARLNYNIYTSPAYITVWGDGTGGTSTQDYAGDQNAGQILLTGYGRIAASQFVSAGGYGDTITVLVTF